MRLQGVHRRHAGRIHATFLPLVLFLGLMLLLAAGLRSNPRDLPSARLDQVAPAFSLPDVSDPQALLRPADYRGQVWVLNVWASWCAACLDEHPVLQRFAGSGVVPVLGLNHKDKRESARAWLAQHGSAWQLSGLDADGLVGIDYGVYGVPETFVIDRQGRIRMRHAGPLSDELLRSRILPLIASLKND